jgi:hypothetical protein
MKKILLFASLLFLGSGGFLCAQTATSTSARQVEQQSRIKGGVKNKDLTRRETVRLEREQRKIKLEKKAAKADGKITPKEKRFLKKEQNRASRHIAKQKNDKQERKF